MKLIDRYLIREIVPPFAIALLVFTFILIIPFILDLAEQLIAKGVAWPTVLRLAATLVPQALGLTIPMAFLIAILVALGRLSGDREIVVLMACGVSPYRLLRPIVLAGTICAAATAWVMLELIPNENQNYREIISRIVADRAEGQVRPREFFEDFPDTVLYVREIPAGGGWQDVFAANTKNVAQPIVFVAKRGRMVVDRAQRTIEMVLEEGTRHSTQPADPATYEVVRFQQMVLSLNPDSVFPRTGPARGDRELSINELQEKRAEFEGRGLSAHNQIIEIHKKFSIPAACLVFAIVGIALGLSNRRDGKFASFVVGILVIFAYYVIMYTAHAMAKGGLVPAWAAMWLPNIIIGAGGALLLWTRIHGAEERIRISVPAVQWLRRRRRGLTSAGDHDDAEVVTAARPAGRVVLVLRVPHIHILRPNLLDLYVARLYGRMLGLSVLGMLGLFYLSTFIDKSDKWFKGQVTLGTLLEYMAWSTPRFLYYILAISVLLATLITIGLLTKSSELIVMRACGVSLYRTSLPLLLFALAAGGILFACEERVLSITNRRAEYLEHIIRGGSPQTFDVLSNRKWLMGGDNEMYHYDYYDPNRKELNALSVFEFDPVTRGLTRRTYARHASFLPRAAADALPWEARNGWQREFAGNDVARFAPFDVTRLPLEPATHFVTEAPEPDRMNFADLRDYIQGLMARGYNVLEYQVELQRKIAFPFVTIIMTLIAVPFAVMTGRRGAMYGIGAGIVLALAYWTMISVFAAIGTAGLVPPILAAWAANLIFGTAALYLLFTVRT
jgi:LPS export ABC transporter permease LptF/LPS export ABC transporter permease LptG